MLTLSRYWKFARYLRDGVVAWTSALRDRRRTGRVSLHLIAYYWNGGVPEGHAVTSASGDGAFVAASDRWRPGTVLLLTFQHKQEDDRGAVTVRGKVVRTDSEGIAFVFLHARPEDRRRFERFLARGQRKNFERARHTSSGAD